MKQNSGMAIMNARQDELGFDKINSLFDKQFKTIFLPPDGFYDNWDFSDERLNLMKNTILGWLKIDNSSLPVSYSKKIKVPGLYIWQGDKSAILINRKYGKTPFEVGAILAHECMHYYMRQHNLESTEVKINELKTDLATICSGMGILVINGMTHKSHWYLTIILLFLGRIYINEQKRYFGYFTGPEYCQIFQQYLKSKELGGGDVIGFIHPLARSFLPKDISKKSPKQESTIIKLQIGKYRRKLAIQAAAVVIAVSLIIVGKRITDVLFRYTLQPAHQKIF